jgi:hypothetical protein
MVSLTSTHTMDNPIIQGAHLMTVDKIRRFYSTSGNVSHFRVGTLLGPLNEYEMDPLGRSHPSFGKDVLNPGPPPYLYVCTYARAAFFG